MYLKLNKKSFICKTKINENKYTGRRNTFFKSFEKKSIFDAGG